MKPLITPKASAYESAISPQDFTSVLSAVAIASSHGYYNRIDEGAGGGYHSQADQGAQIWYWVCVRYSTMIYPSDTRPGLLKTL